MNLLYVVIGVMLLILGRKYTWTFTAGLVFFIFMELTAKGQFDFPDALVFVIGIVFGVSGGLLAVALRRVVIPLTGVLAAGYLFSRLDSVFKLFMGHQWMPYLAGGLLGLVLTIGVPDWTLTMLSSIVGALMVIKGIKIEPTWMTVAFLGITLAGTVIQMLIMVITRPGTIAGDELLTEEEIARRAELREGTQ